MYDSLPTAVLIRSFQRCHKHSQEDRIDLAQSHRRGLPPKPKHEDPSVLSWLLHLDMDGGISFARVLGAAHDRYTKPLADLIRSPLQYSGFGLPSAGSSRIWPITGDA
ncbi:hypothetical protein JH26_09100 [Microvirga sp. BSC39]|nr:hypothetical protein JH26_09100 [Microvirga sp. BSC39]